MMKMKPEEHLKGWGKEVWWCNGDKYCGKSLFFNKGKKCSFHYHRLKTEHFALHSGKLIIRFGTEPDLSKAQELILEPGEVFFVPPGLIHQMEALEDSELLEFSTTHFEEDSYRIVKRRLKMKLSKQALGAVMMALQKSLLEQEDIVPVLLDFDFEVNDNKELFVKNAPTVDLGKSVDVDYSGLEIEEV